MPTSMTWRCGAPSGSRATTWSAGCASATGWGARPPTSRAATCGSWPPCLRPLARVETELVVQRGRQPRPKLQRVPVTIAAAPLVVDWQEDVRRRSDGARHQQAVWLVEVRLAGVDQEPWWLLTDRPVETAEDRKSTRLKSSHANISDAV